MFIKTARTPWIMGILLPLGAISTASGQTGEPPFYTNFEPGWNYKDQWHAFDSPANRYEDCPNDWLLPHEDYCPYDPSIAPGMPAPAPGDSWTWGPYKFETWPDLENGGQVFSGQRSARQPIFDPYWAAIYHVFNDPADGRDLRLKVQVYDPADILCDCDQQAQPSGYVSDCANLPPPNPSRPNFDVHGGIELTVPYRRETIAGDKEYFFLGINSHQSWSHYVWATKADGWVVSTIPRTKGWHRMEIVVHPYTGGLGDVEFWIDRQLIAQGHRMGGSGSGIGLSYLRLGGDPAIITESHLTNTFEEIWYDEVALTSCLNPRADADGDEDVDQTDFAYFQACLTGPGDPFQAANPLFAAQVCQCYDFDGDQDVDSNDFEVFLNCASGPGIPAEKHCDQ